MCTRLIRLVSPATVALACVALWITASASADVHFFPSPEQPQALGAGPGGLWFFTTPEPPTNANLDYMGPTGAIATYEVPGYLADNTGGVPESEPKVGPEGAVWFVAHDPIYGASIKRYNGGGWAEANLVRPYRDVAVSASGAVWTVFSEDTRSGETLNVGRLVIKKETNGDLESELSEYPSPHLTEFPEDLGEMTVASDGSVWFRSNRFELAHFASGTYSYFSVSDATSIPEAQPVALAAGPIGEVWFCLDTGTTPGGAIGSLTPTGEFHFFQLPAGVSSNSLTLGSDGDIWFTYYDSHNEGGGIAKMTPSGTFTYYPPTLLGGQYEPSGGIAAEPNGPVSVGVFVYSPGSGVATSGILRITPDTPGLPSPDVSPSSPVAGSSPTGSASSPVAGPPPTVIKVKPLVIPAQVRRSVSSLKSSAQAIEPYMTATDVADLAFSLVLVAAAPELAPEILLPGATMETGMQIADAGIGFSISTIASDPPDPHYKAIAAVRPNTAPTLHAKRGVSMAAARVWNAVVANSLSSSAYIDALVTTNERLDGAALAGNCLWTRRQERTAHLYALIAARDLAREQRLVGSVEHDIKVRALPNVVVTAAQLEQVKALVATAGLPSDVLATLRHSGATSGDISQLTAAVLNWRPAALSVAETLASRLHATAPIVKRVRQFARALATPVSCPRAAAHTR